MISLLHLSPSLACCGRQKPSCKLGQQAYSNDLAVEHWGMSESHFINKWHTCWWVTLINKWACLLMSYASSISEHAYWSCNSVHQNFSTLLFLYLACSTHNWLAPSSITLLWLPHSTQSLKTFYKFYLHLDSNDCTVVAPLYTVWTTSPKSKTNYQLTMDLT